MKKRLIMGKKLARYELINNVKEFKYLFANDVKTIITSLTKIKDAISYTNDSTEIIKLTDQVYNNTFKKIFEIKEKFNDWGLTNESMLTYSQAAATGYFSDEDKRQHKATDEVNNDVDDEAIYESEEEGNKRADRNEYNKIKNLKEDTDSLLSEKEMNEAADENALIKDTTQEDYINDYKHINNDYDKYDENNENIYTDDEQLNLRKNKNDIFDSFKIF